MATKDTKAATDKDVATGNTAPKAADTPETITNATARTPLEDRTAAANTRPLKEGETPTGAGGDAGATGDLNGDKMPAAENLPGAEGTKTPSAEEFQATRGSGATAGVAPSVEADMTETWVKIDRASQDPLPLYVHGVGRWQLRVGHEYRLPKDAVSALEDAGVGYHELDRAEAEKAKARSGAR
jgi:hypothetical protein